MRILVALTYYRPHISGLTIYAQRMAEGLAARGHQVTVLTSQYDHHLPVEEDRGGVRIVRQGVAVRIDKGVLMPGFRRRARALAAGHDVVVMHLPTGPLEARAVAAAARHTGRPLVVVYQCDLQLGATPWARLLQASVESAARRVLAQATRVIVLSRGYAESSPLLQPHLDRLVVLPPPAAISAAPPDAAAGFRAAHAPGASAVVGVAARVAAEKGLEHLLAARDTLVEALGDVQLLVTGEPGGALGERRYWRRIAPLFERWGPRARFVGRLSDEAMAAFFGACDVTCLPSVNRTESYGLVQVESLLCGTPVVASDLPGIRDPIAVTGMGALVPPGDAAALALALIAVIRGHADYVRPRHALEEVLGTQQFVARGEVVLREAEGARPEGRGIRHKAKGGRHKAEGRRTDERHAAAPGVDELERLMRVHAASVPPFRALVRAVESVLIRRHLPATGPVLDLGCGDGHFAAATLPTPVRYGLDPDAAATALAARTGAYAEVLTLAADATSLPDGACRVVMANSVLEHIPVLDGPLGECRRVLASDGWLIVTAPSHRFADGLGGAVLLDRLRLPALARRYRAWFNRLSRHRHTDSAEVWRTRLRETGFDVVHSEYYLASSAMRWFDVLHVVSLPCLVSWRLLGRWHWAGSPLLLRHWTRALTRLARRPAGETGAYVFILARKV